MGTKSTADIFFILSVAAVMLAVVGWAQMDVWLASTQWLMVGVMMGVWGVYLRIRDLHEEKPKKK